MSKINMTEFIDIFCKNDGRYDKLDDATKSSFYFIFNRMMYYKYPSSANFFNHVNIDSARVMDFWRVFLIHSNVDKTDLKSWIYKALKSNGQIRKKSDEWFPEDKNALFEYLKRYHMDIKTFNMHRQFNLSDLKQDFDEFLKFYNA